MTTMNVLQDIPETGVSVPLSPLINHSLKYLQQTAPQSVVNHVIRSIYWMLITAKKHPEFQLMSLDLEAVTYAIIMHDFGWVASFQSKDKRFEVDSANESRRFLERNASRDEWDKHRVQLVWDIIALHGTESIALHKQPEVACAFIAISQDFFPPGTVGRFITLEEHMAVAKHFPRGAMKLELTEILCALCGNKPQTTFDNFVASFGLVFGVDGRGERKQEFQKEFDDALMAPHLVASMQHLAELEQSDKQ